MERLLMLYAKFKAILRDEHGATMIEYALMVVFIAVVAFAAVEALGTTTNALFALFP